MFSNLLSAIQGTGTDSEEPGNNEEQKNNGSDRKVPGLSFYDVASSVVSSVKDSADDLVSTIKDTKWSNEFMSFGKAIQDDTVEAFKNFETLPEKAGEVLPGMTSVGRSMGTGLQKLVVGYKELFDQAVGAIDAELVSNRASDGSSSGNQSSGNVKYSRFESEVMAMQRDSHTYCDEPEDAEDFQKWKETFSLEDRQEDIAKLLSEDSFMTELHRKIVPIVVENEIFWMRYFYQLQKLQEKHDQRQQLAERALKLHEEEQQVDWEEEQQVDLEEGPTLPTPPAAPEVSSINETKPENKEDNEWDLVEQPTTQDRQEDVKKSKSEEELDEDWGNWE